MSVCSTISGKNVLSFESPSFLVPFLHQVQASCLFEPKALWTVSVQHTDMIYGYSHLLICCYGILPAYKVTGQFCYECLYHRSKALSRHSAASAICFAWHLTGQGRNRWEGNTMPHFYLLFLTSWHFVPPFFHLLLGKMWTKKPPNFETENKKQSASFRLHFSL